MRNRVRSLTIALTLALTGWAIASGEALHDFHQIVTITPDGSILVEESFTAVSDGEFTVVDVCHFPDKAGESISFVGSGPEATVDQVLTTAYNEEYGCLWVGARAPAPTTEHRLSYSYQIDGGMEAFGDVVRWSRNMRSLGSIPIYDYSLTITFPGTFDFPYFVKYRSSTIEFLNPPTPPFETYEAIEGADGTATRYTLEIEEVRFSQPITVDLLLPPDAFSFEGEGEQLHYLIGQIGPVPHPLNHAFRLPVGTMQLSEIVCRERIGELWGMLRSSILQTTSSPVCYLAPASNAIEAYSGIRNALREGSYQSGSTSSAVLTPGVSYARYEHNLMNHYLVIVTVRNRGEYFWLVSMGLTP